MKVLVVGSGGREHALAWKLADSPLSPTIYLAPGNPGTAAEPGVENVELDPADLDGLCDFATRESIDLTIVGPEGPLVAGIVDRFKARGLAIFGPTQQAAQLEGSKAFTKDFLARHSIPTGDYAVFTELPPAIKYIEAKGAPIVIKADGLAAGKGVVLASSVAKAKQAVANMLSDGAFGQAGRRVVVEEMLRGEEASFICMVDGSNILSLASSQDHKARDEGDQGPNTGGMGAYSPAPVVTPDIHARIVREVIEPTVRGMAQEGMPFTGFLYAGLMVSPEGTPSVLEYNVRFGDPETQPIMMRLNSDLLQLFLTAVEGTLDQVEIEWDPRPALGVVMAAAGYPGDYDKGAVISGLDAAPTKDCKVFQAGTRRRENGDLVTDGGRVLCVTALGNSVGEARRKAYARVDKIQWQGAFCRRDIGYRAIAREAGLDG